MKEDIPISQRQVENGEVKATQLPANYSSHFQSENVIFASSNKLFHNVYNSPQKKRQRTEHISKG